PLLLFRELAALGEMRVVPRLGQVPPLADFDPFAVYCSWEITLSAPELSEAAIREVFEFVDGDCDILIAQAGSTPMAAFDMPEMAAEAEPPEPDEPDLSSLWALTEDEMAETAGPLASVGSFAPEPPAAPVGEQDSFEEPPGLSFAALAEEIRPSAPPPPAKPSAPPAARGLPAATEAEDGHRSVGVQSIRVDLDKVDRVVNMVGELVITQSMLTQQMDETLRARYTELVRGLEVLAQTTRGL